MNIPEEKIEIAKIPTAQIPAFTLKLTTGLSAFFIYLYPINDRIKGTA